MTKDQANLKSFAEWCDSKGNKKYSYISRDCAIAQYCKSLGIKYNCTSISKGVLYYIANNELPYIDFWRNAEILAVVANPRTFSNLAKMIRKHL